MPVLIIESGADQGERFEIKQELTLGRHSSCDIILQAAGISRRQCRIYKQGENYLLEDLQSRNGTYLNGEAVTEPVVLKNNDMLNISHFMLRYMVRLNTVFDEQRHRATSFVLQEDDGRSLDMSVSIDASMYPGLARESNAQFDSAALQARGTDAIELQKRLDIFYQVAQALTSVVDGDSLLKEIVECLFSVFPQCDRAFIMTGISLEDMDVRAIRTRDEKKDRLGQITVSRTVLEDVLTRKEALLIGDVTANDQFAQAQSIIAQQIASVMCVPLICQDQIYGVIQLENYSVTDPFDPVDLNLLVGIAVQAALSLRNSRLMQQVAVEANRRAQLQRFFSPTVAKQVMNNDVQLGGELRDGCVMFCDIVGFTSLSEKLRAGEVIKFLNQYFGIMVGIILGENGTVDKFGGDAIMAVWGAPLTVPGDVHHAICCALKMQNAIVRFNQDLAAQGVQPFLMGIGIHAGEFIAGNIGSEDRMEYTLIGDDVNLAKRVESTAQGDMLMVSEALLARDSRVRVLGTSFNPISLKGKSLQYVLASVRGVATEDGYLLSIPATLDGQTGKITFCNHAGDHFKFVCATPITLGDRALQLQIVERPDEAPVTVTVSQAAEGPFYDFVCQERPAYLQLMMDQGLVDGGREIDWKR